MFNYSFTEKIFPFFSLQPLRSYLKTVPLKANKWISLGVIFSLLFTQVSKLLNWKEKGFEQR